MEGQWVARFPGPQEQAFMTCPKDTRAILGFDAILVAGGMEWPGLGSTTQSPSPLGF